MAIGVFYRRRMLLSGENHDDVFVVVDDNGGKVIPFCCVNHPVHYSYRHGRHGRGHTAV